MLFSQVIGQKSLTQKLRFLLYENRLAHALLLTGKEGFGALPIALALAQYVVCDKIQAAIASENGDPHILSDACGKCDACVKASKMIHPDVHYSFPVITKKAGSPPLSTDYITEWRSFVKENPYGTAYEWLQYIAAENKQGNITAHECNHILQTLSLKSYESGYKILIMWLPEYLGREGNILLKIIEEPPPDTLFILVTENEAQLLPTLISRCQRIAIPPINIPEIQAELIANYNIQEQKAHQIALLSEGSYSAAMEMIADKHENWEKLLRNWLNAILKGGPMPQSTFVDDIAARGREKQKQFLKYFLLVIEQAIRIGIGGKLAESYSPTQIAFGEKLNKQIQPEQYEAISEVLSNAIYHIERNANSKLLFRAVTLKIYHILKDKILYF